MTAIQEPCNSCSLADLKLQDRQMSNSYTQAEQQLYSSGGHVGSMRVKEGQGRLRKVKEGQGRSRKVKEGQGRSREVNEGQ